MRIPIALDSGAHGLFNTKIRKFNKKATTLGDQHHRLNLYAALDGNPHHSRPFRKYLDRYMTYLEHVHKALAFYVSIDLLFNPKASYEVWKEMRANGFNPLPVVHYGEDISWISKYLKHTDYVGIGGLGSLVRKEQYYAWADQVFGLTRFKAHGFALTAFNLMSRYPWYSVDSTTAFLRARMGGLMMPSMEVHGKKIEFRYDRADTPMWVTERMGRQRWHALHMPETSQRGLRILLEELGMKFEDVHTEYHHRDFFNLVFMNRVIQNLGDLSEERGFPRMQYYVSGYPSAGYSTMLGLLRRLAAINQVNNIRYLGTFFQYQWQLVNLLLEKWHHIDLEQMKNAVRTTSQRPQPVQRKSAYHRIYGRTD